MGRPPLDRLRALVHAFVASECEEAAVHGALSDGGKRFSQVPRSAGEIATYAGAMADMFCAYLRDLGAGEG